MNKINSIRKDWSLIETLIAQDRKILDIGCGDGGLMEQLENNRNAITHGIELNSCLLYTSPSPRDRTTSRMPSSA